MTVTSIIVAGIEIPSRDPAFLAVVAVHVLFGLAGTITGATAMLSPKRSGRHPWVGTIYYWCLTGVFVTAGALAVVRWAEDYHLIILGTLAFAAAHLGRMARRRRWSNWVRLHITGMGTSYIFLLTAFYVDNGKNLPVWRDLPPVAYWLVPLWLGSRLLFVRCYGIRWRGPAIVFPTILDDKRTFVPWSADYTLIHCLGRAQVLRRAQWRDVTT